MAHRSIPDPDPDPGDRYSFREERSPRTARHSGTSEPVGFEADLAELASKFASEEGGHLPAELSADLALQVVLNEIVEQACTGTGAGGAAIILERDEEWVCRASAGESAPELGARLGSDSGLIAQCIMTGRAQRCDDAVTDLRVDIAACQALGVRSFIALPLLRDQRVIGVFAAFSARVAAFREEEERMLAALARCVIGTITQASDPEVTLANVQAREAFEVQQRREEETAAVSLRNEPVLAMPNPEVSEAVQFRSRDRADERFSKEEIQTEERGEVDKSELILAETVSTMDSGESQLQTEPEYLDIPQIEDEIAPRGGMSFITWVLAVAVVAIAAFVITISGERLLGTNRRPEHRTSAVPSIRQNSDDRNAGSAATSSLAPGSSPNTEATKDLAKTISTETKTRPASVSRTGSLAVFENGREVFRMPRAQMQHSARDNGADTPASSVEHAGIYELSQKDAEDNLIYRVEPIYPESAREEQIQGAVVLKVTAGADGRVQNATAISGPAQLVDSAITAVKQWQFRPHLVNGKSVPIATRITLNFSLPR